MKTGSLSYSLDNEPSHDWHWNTSRNNLSSSKKSTTPFTRYAFVIWWAITEKAIYSEICFWVLWVFQKVDDFFEETKGKKVIPFIIHANNPETRDLIIEKLKENDPSILEVASVPLTAVVGAHSGPKTIGLGYYIQK